MKSRLKLFFRLIALVLIGCLTIPLLPWLRRRTTDSLSIRESSPCRKADQR